MITVVDTSVAMAILRGEPEAGALLDVLASADQRLMSAGSYLEAGIVMAHGPDPEGIELLRKLVDLAEIEIVAMTKEEADVGMEAHRLFGRGSGHPAKLNFGDCFAYALAKTRKLPLLFKGDDFVHTDVEPALKPA